MKNCRQSQPQNRKMESKATPGEQNKRPRGPQVDQKGVQGDPREGQGNPKWCQKAMGPERAKARSAERVKEFLRRLQAQGSLFAKHHTNKHHANK